MTRKWRVGSILFALLLFAAGCGGGQKPTAKGNKAGGASSSSKAQQSPSEDPFESFKAMSVSAMKKDVEEVKNRVTANYIKTTVAPLRAQLKAAEKDENMQKGFASAFGVPWEQLKSSSDEELFTTIIGSGPKMSDEQLAETKKEMAATKVVDKQEEDGKVTLTMQDAKGGKQTIVLVAEDGIWKLDRMGQPEPTKP